MYLWVCEEYSCVQEKANLIPGALTQIALSNQTSDLHHCLCIPPSIAGQLHSEGFQLSPSSLVPSFLSFLCPHLPNREWPHSLLSFYPMLVLRQRSHTAYLLHYFHTSCPATKKQRESYPSFFSAWITLHRISEIMIWIDRSGMRRTQNQTLHLVLSCVLCPSETPLIPTFWS